MPYYVFRLSADRKNLTLLNTCAKYPEAKELCRGLRVQQGPNDTDLIRMAFAQNEKDAKRLLSESRKESSPIEEWEA
jgi:hypothetical protein